MTGTQWSDERFLIFRWSLLGKTARGDPTRDFSRLGNGNTWNARIFQNAKAFMISLVVLGSKLTVVRCEVSTPLAYGNIPNAAIFIESSLDLRNAASEGK